MQDAAKHLGPARKQLMDVPPGHILVSITPGRQELLPELIPAKQDAQQHLELARRQLRRMRSR